VLWFGFAFAPWIVGLGREALLGPLEALLDAGWRLGGLLPSLAAKVDACSRPSECLPMEARGIVGLGVGYGAYIAEIVRAGIESVGAGQHEAAASLGMSRRQAMRHVVLPQAMRLALPPLGNDLVALLKDSSLISILAVPDLVHVARVHVARTFEALETWNLVALLYLMLTLSLSAGVRWLERRGSWTKGEGND
jgi:ABC-type amino acid transport system permease subunit